MITGFSIFRKLPDQFLEDISHLHIVNGSRIQIQFGECLYHGKQTVVLIHLVDLLVEIQALLRRQDDFLNIRRESLDITLEVGCKMIRIIHKLRQIILTGVIKLEPGNTVHSFCREIRIRFVLIDNLLLCRLQSTLKTADDRHRDDDILILIALIRSTQLVGDRPDEVHLCRYINRGIIPHRVDYCFFSHCLISPFFVGQSFRILPIF